VKHTFKKISLCRYKNVKGLEWGNDRRRHRFVFMIKLEFLDGTERYAFFNGLYSYTNNFGYDTFQGMKKMSQSKSCEIKPFMYDDSIQVEE
jgi:hypothetical protein